MDRGSGLSKNHIAKLLLLASLVAGAVHITAASALESSNSTSTGGSIFFTKHKEATTEQLGHYSIVWTDLNPESDNGEGVCYVTGYYDDSILTTPATVQLCFILLRSSIVSDYMSGGIYYSDTFYPELEFDETYCFVNCQEQVPHAGIPSVPLSSAIPPHGSSACIPSVPLSSAIPPHGSSAGIPSVPLSSAIPPHGSSADIPSESVSLSNAIIVIFPPGSSAAIPSVPLSNAILPLGLSTLIMLALN